MINILKIRSMYLHFTQDLLIELVWLTWNFKQSDYHPTKWKALPKCVCHRVFLFA